VIDVEWLAGIEVAELIEMFGPTYYELSPNGGLHGIYRIRAPLDLRTEGRLTINGYSFKYEAYTKKHFMTLTGEAAEIEAPWRDGEYGFISDAGLELLRASPRVKTREPSGPQVKPRWGFTPEQLAGIVVKPEFLKLFSPGLGSYQVSAEKVCPAIKHELGEAGFWVWDLYCQQDAAAYKTPDSAGNEGEAWARAKWDSYAGKGQEDITWSSIDKEAKDSGVILGEPVAGKDQMAELAKVAIALDAPQDDYPEFSRNQKGRIENTISNVILAVGSHKLTGVHIAWDTFFDRARLSTNGVIWRDKKDADNVRMRSQMEGFGFRPDPGAEKVRSAIDLVAQSHPYDSAQRKLENLPAWDKTRRVERWCPDYLNTEDTAYAWALGEYWWTAMIGRILAPGLHLEMVPVLVSDKQGQHKTLAIRAMALDPEWLGSLDFNKPLPDIYRGLRGKVIVELGELKGIRGKEVEHIKDFLSEQENRWVPKYKEDEVAYRRRCVIAATTNTRRFLTDETGNRRWLPIPVESKIDLDPIGRDLEQLWAEALVLYCKHGGVMYEEVEILAEAEHPKYMVYDVHEEALITWLDTIDAEGVRRGDRDKLLAADVWEGLNIFKLGDKYRLSESMHRAMRKLGWEFKDSVRVREQRGKGFENVTAIAMTRGDRRRKQ
jgi:predicted P-loop ATPase